LGARYVKFIEILLSNPTLTGIFTPTFLGELTTTILTNFDLQTTSTFPNSNDEEVRVDKNRA
jgi:hypothetical protein